MPKTYRVWVCNRPWAAILRQLGCNRKSRFCHRPRRRTPLCTRDPQQRGLRQRAATAVCGALGPVTKREFQLTPILPQELRNQWEIKMKVRLRLYRGCLGMITYTRTPDSLHDIWCRVPQADMGGCQNYGPFLGTLNIRWRTIIGTQKGTIILTTTHIQEPILKRWLMMQGLDVLLS